jgi:retinol-binding protein 3
MQRKLIRTLAIAAVLPLLAMLYAQAPVPADGSISKELTKQTVETLAAAMKSDYVFPEVADKVDSMLRERLKKGEYDSVSSGQELAKLLTEQMNAICKDAHLGVRYSAQPLPARQQRREPSPEEIKRAQEFTRQTNSGYEKVERLLGNVGYLEVRSFGADAEEAKAPAAAAMNFLSNTAALIIDVRRNGGGQPEHVQLLCSYLFGDEPVHLNDLYFREGNKTEEFWTLKAVDGRRYQGKPVYVLASKRTGSGAEEFCYNLQNLKRATIVGESTWGGANPGGTQRLNDHFAVFIPTGRAINPITKTNWEGTGVQPDVAVPADQALKTAHIMAVKDLLAKAKSDEEKQRLKQTLDMLEKGS